MQQTKIIQNTFKKYIWKAIGLIMILFLLAVGAVYYVSTSQGSDGMPELITRYAKDNWDVNLGFDSYQTSRSENFPFLTFKLNGLFIEGSDCMGCKSDLLNVEELTFKIQPLDLIRNFIHIKDAQISGAKIRFHKGEFGNRKIDFLREFNSDDDDKKLVRRFKMDSLLLQNVLLEYADDVKEKQYGVTIKRALLTSRREGKKFHLQTNAQCHFAGLNFKPENGFFLKDTDGNLALNLEILKDSIHLRNSTLLVAEDTFNLSGNLSRTEIPTVDLNISSKSIVLKNASILLDDKLQKILNRFSIDTPLDVNFRLHGKIKPRHKLAIDVDFKTIDADFWFKGTQVSKMKLDASYSNHCQTQGDKIKRGEGCLTVHRVQGMLFDEHEVDLQGIVHDFKKMKLDMDGLVVLDLPALQPYLAKTNYVLRKGKADVSLDYSGNFKTILSGKFLQKKGVAAAINLRDVAFDFKSLQFKSTRGKIDLSAQSTKLKNIQFSYLKQKFSLDGELGNVLPFLFNKQGKTQANLNIKANKIDALKLIPPSSPKSTEKIEIGTSLARSVNSSLSILTGQINFNIDEFTHGKNRAKDVSFSLELPDEPEYVSRNFLNLQKAKFTLFDSLQVLANATIKNIDNPFASVDFSVKSSLSALENFQKEKNILLKFGKIDLTANTEFLLNDITEISLNNLENIDFSGVVKIVNADLELLKNKQKLKNINSEFIFNKDLFELKKMTGFVSDISIDMSGEVQHYFALLTPKNQPADANFKIHLGTLDLRPSKTSKKGKEVVAVRSFFQSFQADLQRIKGRADILVDRIETPLYPFTDVSFALSADSDTTEISFVKLENFQANIFGTTPLYAQLKITDLANPTLETHLQSEMKIEDLSKLILNDNFQAKKGDVGLKLFYKNELRDSLNLEYYLLTADMRGQLKFSDVELYYAPRGLNFEQMNGDIDFTQDNLLVNFPKMLFNKNVINLTGNSKDFLPFFFEENQDFTLDLTMNSPHVNFHNFDTPKTLKEQTDVELTDAQQEEIENVIDRLLSEGNLSLNTKIAEVIYDDFLATNVVGRANITDNEVTLDTFRMHTADGYFGINATISDIDTEKIKITTDLDFSNISAPIAFKGFDNFGQTTLTDAQIKGTIDAKINFSASMNDNYEIFGKTMSGELDLNIRNGAFIDFNGLTNLNGFLFKKRKLDHVYFAKMQTQILLKGLDMSFKPFVLNSTAATLQIDGLYSFSEKDRMDLTIEVPLGNLFTRYVERAKIRKNHKRRTGLPIIVEVSEKDKIPQFNIRLSRRED